MLKEHNDAIDNLIDVLAQKRVLEDLGRRF